VIVDAAFLRRDQRDRFAALARHLGSPWLILHCQPGRMNWRGGWPSAGRPGRILRRPPRRCCSSSWAMPRDWMPTNRSAVTVGDCRPPVAQVLQRWLEPR
jgi:hypothetical protein